MSHIYKESDVDDIDLNIDYNECCLSSVAISCNGKICHMKSNWPRHCVYISQLQDSVTDYLISIKVISSQQQNFYSITEEELLLNRLSRVIVIEQPNLKICPNHRYTYGIGWSVPASCVYLELDGSICHLRSDRVAPMHLIQSISMFPFGGKICRKHRGYLYDNDDLQTNAITEPVSGVHTWEVVTDNADQVNEVLCLLEQSPIKSQAIQIPIQNQAPGSQRRIIAKLRKSVAASAISVANSLVAPGQVEILLEMAGLSNVVGIRSSTTTSTSDDQVIERLVEIYKAFEQKQYPFIERIQLLAILPQNMSNKEIIEKFGCSNYAVKTARKLQLTTTTPTHYEESEKIIRNRINPLLTDHFLSWLLETGMLKTVAWGVTKISLSRGDVLEIPKQVLQGKKSHIIQQYQMHCEGMSIQSLSDRTLNYILDSISKTEQEALSGIDDIVKDAREGWLKIEELLPSFKLLKEDRNMVLSKIKESKLYLKTLFINHCSETKTKTCKTHCLAYSLSQPGSGYYSETCNHNHNEFCEDCASLIEVLDFIDEQIDQISDAEEKNELKYDFQQAREAIIELMRHLVRAVQQDNAKSILLNQMDKETAFVTIDWAQKVLQQKHREGQSEYFGKKGMSILVASFTIKDVNQSAQDKFITKTYMLALTRCNQNEYDTLSGGFLLLNQFKNEHQHINKIIKRSDNASVLGGHATFETEKLFCDQLGIQILIRDYSEVQRGKSVCDRMAGAAKLRMRAWVNAGNNLLNASDIKKGMEYCGGVKNLKIGVAELINDKLKINSTAIPEINSIRSVFYTDDGMIIRKASNIGRGRLIPYCNIQVTCNMKLIEPFTPSNRKLNTSKQTERLDRQINTFYFCTVFSCISTFKDEAALNDHIALGQHLTKDSKMNTLDIAKLQLFDKLHDIDSSISTAQVATIPSSASTSSNTILTPSHSPATLSSSTTTALNSTTTASISTTTTSISTSAALFNQLNTSKTMKYFSSEGWALKIQKPRRPIDEAVKLYIKAIMNEEKLYSIKFSEKDYVRRIRTARQNNGKKMFSPDQYLTSSQVKTQIKILSKQSSNRDRKGQQRVTQNSPIDMDEDEDQYKKTPRLSRKQISIRTSTLNTSLTQSSQSSNNQNVFDQDLSDDDIDEEDEIALEQKKQMDIFKKKILAP